ncbi:hypothetical protein [Nocardia araoensis]|uniref:hypothetical protein n=1 Tax=Nocardia araoensis TaxID=228600 RepID=UPI0012F6BC74|nr:hypothetical protein [Nocardia araoensis]
MLEIENNEHFDLEPARDREHVPDRIIDIDRRTNRVDVLIAERESMPLHCIGMPWCVRAGHVIANEPDRLRLTTYLVPP